MRQIDVLRVAAECELENAHPRKATIVAQLFYVRRNHSEILSDDWQLTELASNRCKQFFSRRLNPAAAFCGLVAARNLPTGGEAAKVIDACDVHGLQRGPHALNPPLETIRQHAVPVVKRITPELSGDAEIIRRYSGHYSGTSTLIQLELIRVSPDIR